MATAQRVRSYPFGEPRGLELDPMYAHVREHEPLCRIRLPYGEDAWLVTRHEDVRTVLADPRFSRAAALSRDVPRTTPVPLPLGILDMDPPEQARLRRLVAKAFTARRVEELRPRAQQICDELLDAFVAAGPPGDLANDLALPLSVTVVCELLGVPYAERNQFGRWAEALLSMTALTPEQRQDYVGQLSAYMAGLVAQRRQRSTDDLLGALVLARDEQDRLTEHELIFLAIGLLAAGHETTVNQVSNFVLVLLDHPGQLRLLREDPGLMPAAVEELSRFVPLSAGPNVPRYAIAEVELSGGTVPAGDPVLASRSAANRDPRVFADPDRLDLRRAPALNFGFGHGVHHCLGAPLARMELQVALAALLDRFPGLDLAVDRSELRWKRGMALRGPMEFPITW